MYNKIATKDPKTATGNNNNMKKYANKLCARNSKIDMMYIF